ncbi:conserved domain protein [Roseibium sp. TrichSKD4]|nr:hypothetical protein [Roseibium sp. TrichSKD4]EFO31659.1 conserved domain protein [Roseibium sp. TrichSKD4]
MDADRFKDEVRLLIDRADISQAMIAVILQELADEQQLEWDEREPEGSDV